MLLFVVVHNAGGMISNCYFLNFSAILFYPKQITTIYF